MPEEVERERGDRSRAIQFTTRIVIPTLFANRVWEFVLSLSAVNHSFDVWHPTSIPRLFYYDFGWEARYLRIESVEMSKFLPS
jgi:hypothetical protein